MSDPFHFQSGELHAEQVPVRQIAEDYGTPAFIYSRAALEAAYDAFSAAFQGHAHMVCYSVKANSNLGVLDVLARKGSGFDIVSGGELSRVIAAGGDPARVVYSGVAKREDEIEMALVHNIACFNVESDFELALIADVAARLGKTAPIAIRVNPDVDPQTHPYISTGLKSNKFGVPMGQVEALYHQAHASPHLRVTGVDCHIGSQITSIDPFADALTIVLDLVDRLQGAGIPVDHVDLGGGIGVRYKDETLVDIYEYAGAVLQILGNRDLELRFEPGRYIAAAAGVLVTRVMGIKQGEDRNFAIVDAAMNDLIRPALYEAWQRIINVSAAPRDQAVYDVVGPVCESGDFLARERELGLVAGDLLVVESSGAYGAVMSSNYNSRGRAPEILVDGDQAHCVRERETSSDLFRLERPLPP